MAEYVSSFIIPIVFLLSSSAFLFPGRDCFASFIRGAKDGLRCAVGLLPAMVLLFSAIAAFRASGAAEAISAFLSPIGGALGIPSELFPLIISRPLSGAAANASFASLASDCGANSFEVFAAAVIMGSSDTLVYVLFVYFSQTRVKKTLYAFPAAAAVAVFSLFVSLFFARLFFA